MVKESGRRISAGGRIVGGVPEPAGHPAHAERSMAGATRTFSIPCRCSATVSVGPGHAGSQVRCPACGGQVDVPRLRELAAYAVTQPPQTGRGWRACHAWLLVGLCVAVVAALAAGLVSRFDGGAAARLPDERLIRSVIESADAKTIHAAWRSIKRSGVDRGTMPDELQVQRAAGSLGRIAGFLWSLAAAGVGAAAGGGLACWLGNPAAAPREGSR